MNTIMQKLFNICWKKFVWLDFVLRYKELPKSIELTDRNDIVRINGVLSGFYSKDFAHGETPEED